MVKLPQSNEMSALIFQPSLVRRPTVASMLITLIVSWRGLNIKISFSFERVRFEFRKSNEVEEKKKNSHFYHLHFRQKIRENFAFSSFFLILLFVWKD